VAVTICGDILIHYALVVSTKPGRAVTAVCAGTAQVRAATEQVNPNGGSGGHQACQQTTRLIICELSAGFLPVHAVLGEKLRD
jgi:hypothetical protein